jgi:amino acid adenylation domain-containing protein
MPLHEHIEWLATQAPDRIVLTAGENRLTAGELDRWADRIAGALRGQGVGRGDLVAIALPRDITLIPSLLGVLKSGAGYVPIDPYLPTARIQAMLDDSSARHVLVHAAAATDPPYYSRNCLDPDALPPAADRGTVTVADSDIAYVIYTSGTTGRPKGVAVEHRSLDNLVCGWAEAVEFPTGATMSSLATVAFDIFIAETLLPMVYGLRIALATDDDVASPAAIADFLGREQVTAMQVTPSRLAWLLADPRMAAALRRVRLLVVGGEAFPPSLLDSARQCTDALIYNVYGPTEATVWTSAKLLKGNEPITVGSPILGVGYHLDNDAISEPGSISEPDSAEPGGAGAGVGELCITGAALARGYLGDIERTRERFGIDGQCYRTGDLARRLDDGEPAGEFVVLGRVDQQIKIDGYRVELGEIETVLAAAPGVTAAVVVSIDGGASRTLAGWLTPDTVDVDEVWKRAATRLPRYMMPSTLVAAAVVPLSPAGKADRHAIVALIRERITATTPPDPADYILAAAAQWNGRPIDLDDPGERSLLELGLGSLATARLAAELASRYQVRLELSDMLQAGSVRALADLASQRADRTTVR